MPPDFIRPRRVIIKNVGPELEEGRYPVKRTAGEELKVKACVFADGHDAISVELLYKKVSEPEWNAVAMKHTGSDIWEAAFTIQDTVSYQYSVKGWVDKFLTWKAGTLKKIAAGQDIAPDTLAGVGYILEAAKGADKRDAKRLKEIASFLKHTGDVSVVDSILRSAELAQLMASYPDTSGSSVYDKELIVHTDRKKALFSSWYEIFPRSSSPEPERAGTIKDCIQLLPRIAEMGFDVLYLPPIHPIGKTNRKGRNNTLTAGPDTPGSPWAIGSEEGGHKSMHPALGTMSDFDNLVKEARRYNIEIALDLAYQCSPDHPYIKEHPRWFYKRPDGSVQFAENPPKKYEDIVPFNFETDDRQALWEELKSIAVFWIERGVSIFRVDNPHTKPFGFWEWLIKEIRGQYPDVIFLSEAFTRPNLMYHLGKIGFSQSYTYFTWRNRKQELIEYFTELTKSSVREFLRPNLWPNTPDILPEYLQYGGRPAFIIRLVLASTLSSNYGIFSPSFELCVTEALADKEEYLNSEKYEIRHWDFDSPGSLKDLISRINRIRRENPALQTSWNLKFHEVDNDMLLFYSKTDMARSNLLLIAVNLDPYHIQSGWVRVPLEELGIDAQYPYLVHDLISDDKYIWHGEKNYVELNPSIMPAHILRVYRKARRENDFDYFM